MQSDRFLACIPFTLIQECPHPEDWSNLKNFSNDAHDPGGKTMCGIIQREYDSYRKRHGELTRDVRQLTREEGYDIYFNEYWLPHCTSLPAGLDLSYFDESVNTGTTEANKVLQAVLGINADGQWGTHTQDAVVAIEDVADVIQRFTSRRKAVYRMMHGFQYFGGDWIRRSNEIGAESLKMAAAQKMADSQ